jgi:hypothetical protein
MWRQQSEGFGEVPGDDARAVPMGSSDLLDGAVQLRDEVPAVRPRRGDQGEGTPAT